MSQKAVLRAAFRFYQSIEVRLERGEITWAQVQALLMDRNLKKRKK